MPLERDGADLVVADGEPGPAAADQKAVHAGGIDQRNQRGVLDPADLQVARIEHTEADEFCAVEHVVRRHRGSSFMCGIVA